MTNNVSEGIHRGRSMASHSAMLTVPKLLDMLIARVGVRVVSCWILNIFPRLYEKKNCSAHSLTHSKQGRPALGNIHVYECTV